MWVERRVLYVKPERRSEAAELVKLHATAKGELGIEGWSCRVLLPRSGKDCGSTIVMESTFESFEEGQRWGLGVFATPEAGQVFAEKWMDVWTGHSDWEIYRVAE